jgi:hypothetical protein
MVTTAGIDYGMGLSNVDMSNGIRYGVISSHSVSFEALDESLEPVYLAHCPMCGMLAVPSTDTSDDDTDDWYCPACDMHHSDEAVYGDCAEPDYSQSTDTDYDLADCLDSDIMVTRSPYYTYAAFCSPCVPGAGNLDTELPIGIGIKTYCLGHDFFEDGKAPYTVYSVATNAVVAA